jgi:hypothetical protein
MFCDLADSTGFAARLDAEVWRDLVGGYLDAASAAIRPTLQQSLTARLDRLGPAREVAQIAAVIGRDFSYALLRAGN